MAVTSGFFNSVNGDRTYNADQISDYFLKLISNGVFANPSTSLQVQAASGMNVNVAAGWGFINCKWIKNDSNYSLQLDAADSSMQRIDRVVLHLDTSTTYRTITIIVKTGTPTVSNPEPPDLTRNGTVYELSLAQIKVYAGATEISQTEITDERPDNTVCGWVTGLIDQLDTTELFAQFTAAFNEWFSNIKTEVQATTIVSAFSGVYITSTESETTIPITISNFNPTLDILHVYINGLKLIPGTDYIISGSDIVLASALDVIGTAVEFEVLKSNDTQEAESVVSQVVTIENNVESIDNSITLIENNVTEINENITNITTALDGLKFMKLTQAEYDEIEVPDENTVYIIVSEPEEGE